MLWMVLNVVYVACVFCYMPVLTSPVTFSSISLSDNPRDLSAISGIDYVEQKLTDQWLLLLPAKFCKHRISKSYSPLSCRDSSPYLANIFGSVPNASRIIIGVCGLFFFIVGYARNKKDLLGC